MDAEELFASNWPGVKAVVAYHLKRITLPIQPPDRDDLFQLAALHLWRACRSAVETGHQINWRLVGRAAWSSWSRPRRRNPASAAVGWAGAERDELGGSLDVTTISENAATATVEGVSLTFADVKIDTPEVVELWRTGIGAPEAAKRLSLSEETVRCQARRFGGRAFPGGREGRCEYRFPSDLGKAVPPRR